MSGRGAAALCIPLGLLAAVLDLLLAFLKWVTGDDPSDSVRQALLSFGGVVLCFLYLKWTPPDKLPEKQPEKAAEEKPKDEATAPTPKPKPTYRPAPACPGSTLRCPKCYSPQVQVIDNGRRGFSVGKAAVGGALLGPVGLVGGALGKQGKMRLHCVHCGHMWYQK